MSEGRKFRCPVCGHWCVPADGYGWTCTKRGGCGNEWPTDDNQWVDDLIVRT